MKPLSFHLAILFGWALCLLPIFTSFAQTEEQRCGNHQRPAYFDEKTMQRLIAEHQQTQQQTQQQTGTARTEQTKYIIPVVFHICFQQGGSNLTNRITTAQIQSQLDVLNEDYNRKNADASRTRPQFLNSATSANIEFQLAVMDTLGRRMAEKGVMRYPIYKDEWTDDEFNDQVKTKTIWNPYKYLNIWVVDRVRYKGSSALGYAQFPDLSGLAGLQPTDGTPLTDGVVVAARAFGSIAKDQTLTPLLSPRFAYGRTLSHEIGHFFGVLHTFHEDGQGTCNEDADFCGDTPLIQNKTFGCPTEKITCGILAMTENFMDYTDDFCMNTFTKDQVARMQVVLEKCARRKELLTSTVTSADNQELATLINLYPNPATEQFLLQTSDNLQLQHIKIFSILGQTVYQQVLSGTTAEIKTTSLAKGLYMVCLQTDKGVSWKKITVN